jgi:hypothetical protein
MAKNYSVQMENDEVISVEVDGQTYIRPEDIPDLLDREEIRALISKMTRPDSKEGLNQDFKEELLELNQKPGIIPRVFLAILLGVAAIMFIIAVTSTVQTVQTLSREESVNGTVVDQVFRPSRDSETGIVTNYIYPVVEFAPAGKTLLKVQMSEGSSSPDYAIGDQVTILYDPRQPRDSRIKSSSSNLLLWILPAITFLVGTAFLAVALIFIKFWPPWKRRTVSFPGLETG